MKNLKYKVHCFFICLVVWYFSLFGMNPHGIDFSEELSRCVGLRSGEPSRCDHYQNGAFCFLMGCATLGNIPSSVGFLSRLLFAGNAGCCLEIGCNECNMAGFCEQIAGFFCKE